MLHKYYVIALALLSTQAAFAHNELDCEIAQTTLEINQCALERLHHTEDNMHHYLQVSLKANAQNSKLIEAIQNAQENWKTYSRSHCDSVYTLWQDGSIRNVMAIECKIRLTKLRTHELWRSFLTFMDSTPPLLSEPELPSP